MRGDGLVTLRRPLPADVGLADERRPCSASTPKKREAKRRAVSSLSWSFLVGSERVAEVPMQMISSGVFPARARTRRIRQATSAPVAPA